MGEGSLYAAGSNGYVIADLMVDNALRLSFYTWSPKGIVKSFTYTRPHYSSNQQ
jgi:hypothetical protein